MKAWHGTFSPQGRFDKFEQSSKLISFCTERDGGRIWARPDGLGWIEGSRIFEVDLTVNNPLDFRIPEHVDLVLAYLNEVEKWHFPKHETRFWIEKRGSYQCLEYPDLLIRHGFDSVYSNEFGWLNIHVLRASQIKIKKTYDSDPGSLGLEENRCKIGWVREYPPRGIVGS